MISLKLGAHPSPDDPADFSFSASELLAGALPGGTASPSVLGAHEWRTQLYQDCIGYACVQPVQDLFAVRGEPLPTLAPLMPYGGSRLLASPPATGEALPDGGCNYRLAQKWLRDVGIVSERLFSETDENVAIAPPLDIRQAGKKARIKASHRIIAGTVTELRDQLLAALNLARDGKACAPGFVMPVDEAYANGGAAVYRQRGGKLLGYHGQMIAGIDDVLDVAEVPGTWGRDVGDAGLFRIGLPLLFEIGSEFWVIEIDFADFEVTT